MLSIGRLGSGAVKYYVDQVARGAEDYYVGAGEAPGTWVGSGIAVLGLKEHQEVDPVDLGRILAGQHPTHGHPLVRQSEDRVQGFDLTFSAPKSVSLLWALSDNITVRGAVAAAHDTAVRDALAYLERHATFARRGHGGSDRVGVEGLVAAAFVHRTSRHGDPQLHTHVVVANMVRDGQGRWSAPDSRSFFRHARTAGFVYQAALRAELSETLGVHWGPVRSGQADIAGLTRPQLMAFSSRRSEVEAALERLGLSTTKAARLVTLATRPAKDRSATATPEALKQRWQELANEIGLDPAAIAALIDMPRSSLLKDEAIHELVDRLVSSSGLTRSQSSFDHRDVARAVAESHRDGVRLRHLEALTGTVLDRPEVVALTGDDHRPEPRWTTAELFALEAELQHRAKLGVDAGLAVADPNAVAAAIAARPQLSEQQRAMVQRLCRSGAAIDIVVGKAGAGKTFALDAARDAWGTSGITIVGTAVAARAAAELEAGAGIPSLTLVRLLRELAQTDINVARGGVIVVDEAGMVGTRQLSRLLQLADQQHLKVVLVGDHRQLPEIDAGGAFAALADLLPKSELQENRRQREAWERDALDELRAGHAAAAVGRYGEKGRITVTDSATAARDAMVADWATARLAGDDAIMLAVRRTDVDDLNRRARAALEASGLFQNQAEVILGGLPIAVGDTVLATRNYRRFGLANGTRLRIATVDTDLATITALTTDGRAVSIPFRYAEAGHLSYGYALTVHKAQGATVEQVFLLGDDALFREAGYVGLSRAREASRLYVVAADQLDVPAHQTQGVLDHLIDALGVSRAQQLAHSHLDTATLARPLPELVTEHDELAARLNTTMPADPRPRRWALDVDLNRLAEIISEGNWPREWVHAERQRLIKELADIKNLESGRREWAAQHRPDAERLVSLSAAIERRRADLGRAALASPPPRLLSLLGPPPADLTGRSAWSRAASAVEAWWELAGHQPYKDPLGPRPERGWLRGWWDDAARTVDDACRQMGRPGWQRGDQRGLEP